MNHYGVGHPNASDARCNERTLSNKDSQKLIKFYQASELLWWSLGRMCRWDVVDFMLICGISWARFWWGWKLSQCSLRLEFYKLGQIEVNVCHCNGNFMRTTHVHDIQTQWFKMVAILCLLHCFCVFFWYICMSSYATQAVEVRACWFCSFFHSLLQNLHSLLILWLTHSTAFPFLAFPIDSRFCQVCTARIALTGSARACLPGRIHSLQPTLYPLSSTKKPLGFITN